MLQVADTVAPNLGWSVTGDEELLQELNGPIHISRVNNLILGGCFCQVQFDMLEDEEAYRCDCMPDPYPDCHRRLRNCNCVTDGCDTCYLGLQFHNRHGLFCKTCKKPTSLCVCGAGSCTICIQTHDASHEVDEESEYSTLDSISQEAAEIRDAVISESVSGNVDIWTVQ